MDDVVSRRDVLKICRTEIWNGMDDYRSISAREIAEKVKELPSISPYETINKEHDQDRLCDCCDNYQVCKYAPNMKAVVGSVAAPYRITCDLFKNRRE